MTYLYIILYPAFVLLLTVWFGTELRRPYVLWKHWRWIAAASIVGLFGALINTSSDVLVNFFLHCTGGAAATLLFIYFVKTLDLRFSWLLTTAFLFAFVCTVGVVNELAEYALDLLGQAMYSLDLHDTWRDLVANTTGAAVSWLLYSVWNKTRRRTSA